MRIWRDMPDNLPATMAFDSALENALAQTRQSAVQLAANPAGSMANAKRIAAQLQDQNAALTHGVNRLLRLARLRPPTATADVRAICTQIIEREIHYRPSLAFAVWNVGSREGLYPGPLKHARGELVTAEHFPAARCKPSSATPAIGWAGFPGAMRSLQNISWPCATAPRWRFNCTAIKAGGSICCTNG